jgi:PAS domain S-box-containing protein
MTLIKKRIVLYICIFVLSVAISIGLTQATFKSNEAFHEKVTTVSAMISLFAGLLSMIRYYAKRTCPYLWVGLAFVGNGVIECMYSCIYSFPQVFNIPTDISSFMMWGWWFGRMYLATMLLCSYLTCRQPTSPLKEKQAYALAGILVSVCLLILSCIRLPSPVFTIIPRPFEYLPGILYLLAIIGFFKYFDWRGSAFPHWLICGSILLLSLQIFIIPYSQRTYDARFASCNILKSIAYILVAIGLFSEIFKLYRKYEHETTRLRSLRLAMNQVKDYAMYLLDPNGNIVTSNIGSQTIKGYTEGEIIGKHFSVFYSEKERKDRKPQSELRKAIDEGHLIIEDWRVKKDGTKFWASVIITPIYDKSGTLIGFVKITKDLTEWKIVEEELKKQNESLLNANEQLTQFAYIATHDLKEPLRTISSFSQLLTRACGATNEKATKYAEFIIKSVERIRKLVDDLRIYTIIKSKGLEQTKTDLNVSLMDAMNLLKKKIEDTHAEIKTCKLPSVVGSASQLMYLFLHLIDNAIKYARPGSKPSVEVCCKEVGTEYIISVKDDGVGIPDEYVGKLFSIFRKLDDRRYTDGTGIGLFICKNVIASHGGRIWFKSGENGTTFYFALPMIKSLNTN